MFSLYAFSLTKAIQNHSRIFEMVLNNPDNFFICFNQILHIGLFPQFKNGNTNTKFGFMRFY